MSYIEMNDILTADMYKSKVNGQTKYKAESYGDEHIMTSIETPMRKDAFALSEEEKIHIIEHHFGKIMDALGLDRTDDSLSGTPYRVAKMFVKEIFYGRTATIFLIFQPFFKIQCF